MGANGACVGRVGVSSKYDDVDVVEACAARGLASHTLRRGGNPRSSGLPFDISVNGDRCQVKCSERDNSTVCECRYTLRTPLRAVHTTSTPNAHIFIVVSVRNVYLTSAARETVGGCLE